MAQFNDWGNSVDTSTSNHFLRVMIARPETLVIGVQATAMEVLPIMLPRNASPRRLPS